MAKISTTDEWSDAVKKHIEKLTTDDERYNFAHSLIFDLALWTGYNSYETIGILECVKQELLDAIKYTHDDIEEDDD